MAKQTLALLFVMLTGCSTAPVADMMDHYRPGRLGPHICTPYGGVCAPRPVGSGTAAVPFIAPPPPPSTFLQ